MIVLTMCYLCGCTYYAQYYASNGREERKVSMVCIIWNKEAGHPIPCGFAFCMVHTGVLQQILGLYLLVGTGFKMSLLNFETG